LAKRSCRMPTAWLAPQNRPPRPAGYYNYLVDFCFLVLYYTPIKERFYTFHSPPSVTGRVISLPVLSFVAACSLVHSGPSGVVFSSMIAVVKLVLVSSLMTEAMSSEKSCTVGSQSNQNLSFWCTIVNLQQRYPKHVKNAT